MSVEIPLLAFGVDSIPRYTRLNEVIFQGALTNKGLFLIAMAYGYKNNFLVTEFKKSQTGPRTELDEGDFALMSAIQLAHTKNPESIKDLKQRNELAQQFAEGGIVLLSNWLDDKSRRDPRGDFVNLIINPITRS